MTFCWALVGFEEHLVFLGLCLSSSLIVCSSALPFDRVLCF